MNFGKAVLMGMASIGMKRKELAEALGKSINYIHDICNNQKQPSLNLLMEMANLFHVKLSTLISWGEE